jgi:hypothetical protein
MVPSQEMFRGLKDTFGRTTNVQTAMQALQEAELFCTQVGEFGTDMARQMAMDPKTSPCKNYSLTTSSYSCIGIFYLHTCFAHAAAWWMLFGSSTPNLTKLALRLVSQCCSSSGCERNWSTFALLHTKVRNRLSHKKLNKLVYVNYNLRLRLAEVVGPPVHDEGDFIDRFAHLSFYEHNNPLREWMEYGRSNHGPVLDEDDDDGDVPLPSHIVTDHINDSDLHDATGDACISDWAHRNVGNTHLGKRMLHKRATMSDPKRQQQQIQTRGKGKAAKPVTSDTSTDDGDGQRSPPYQESADSSSADDADDDDSDGDGDGDDDDGGGGGGGGGGAIGVCFTGIHCTCIHFSLHTHVSHSEY